MNNFEIIPPESRPNLFVVGVGKSGTYFLYNHLSKHPDIFMSPIKEPTYFGNDLCFQNTRISKEKYLGLFINTSSFKYRGEASVSYLLSETAASEISTFSPNAKIIILIRNPIDVIYARYYQNRKYAYEPCKTFREALEMEKLRRMDIAIPKHTPVKEWLFYSEWVCYSKQIQRYFNYFPKENVFIGIYDDLNQNPSSFLYNLGLFLQIDGLEKIPIKKINKNTIARSTVLTRLNRGHFTFLNYLVCLILPSRLVRSKLKQYIDNYNYRTAPRPALEISLAEQLKKQLENEIKNTENLLNIDLSHWKNL